ncbi:MAG: acyltransferase [Patescibacteria group bacterium]
MLFSWYKKTSSIPLLILNGIVQRIFMLNGRSRWMVHYTSRVICPQKITMGAHVERSFARSGGCYIQALNGITFGDDVLFGPGVKIISGNHGFVARHAITVAPPIRIGSRVWIGANAIILPGVEIGDDSIVGAGSVVTHSFPEHSVIAGNPARLLRHNDSAHQT